MEKHDGGSRINFYAWCNDYFRLIFLLPTARCNLISCRANIHRDINQTLPCRISTNTNIQWTRSWPNRNETVRFRRPSVRWIFSRLLEYFYFIVAFIWLSLSPLSLDDGDSPIRVGNVDGVLFISIVLRLVTRLNSNQSRPRIGQQIALTNLKCRLGVGFSL
jgi:hypothetical protein